MTANELRTVLTTNRDQLVSLREVAEARGKHVTQIRVDAGSTGFPSPVITVGVGNLYLADEIVKFYKNRETVRRGPVPGADAEASAQRVATLTARLS